MLRIGYPVVHHDRYMIVDHYIAIHFIFGFPSGRIPEQVASVVTLSFYISPDTRHDFCSFYKAELAPELSHRLGTRDSLDADRAVGNHEGATAAGLDQVLILVVVDVEVIEHCNGAALVSAEVVVVHVDDDRL